MTTGRERFLIVICPNFKCPHWEGHLTDHPQPPVSYFHESLSAASSEWLYSNFWTVLVACSAVMARVWLHLCLPLFLFTSTLCIDVSLIQGRCMSFLFCGFKCFFNTLLIYTFALIKTIFCWLLLVPTNDGISGVLLVQTKNNVYSFNATTAKEACEAIQMRIAQKAEVETANKNGFQTCR